VAIVELAGPTERELDAESADWVRRLSASDGSRRQEAEGELHARLVRIALSEVNRRSGSTAITSAELTHVSHQAADDAMPAILAKLKDFRGESRFITWAYRFVILEVSAKLGRHYWRNPPIALDAGQWENLPDRVRDQPAAARRGSGSPGRGALRRPGRADRAPATDLRRDRG
jgi:RNA polymerase sigma-70 factor (ECF subfamily)